MIRYVNGWLFEQLEDKMKNVSGLGSVKVKMDNCGNIILTRNKEKCFLQEGFSGTQYFIKMISKRAFNLIYMGLEVKIKLPVEYLDDCLIFEK